MSVLKKLSSIRVALGESTRLIPMILRPAAAEGHLAIGKAILNHRLGHGTASAREVSKRRYTPAIGSELAESLQTRSEAWQGRGSAPLERDSGEGHDAVEDDRAKREVMSGVTGQARPGLAIGGQRPDVSPLADWPTLRLEG